MVAFTSPRRSLERPSWLPEAVSSRLDVVAILFEEGIPAGIFGAYFDLGPAVQWIPGRGVKGFLSIGRTGLQGIIGIDPATGIVEEIVSPDVPEVIFVNTTLAAFVETVEAVEARFPFYDADATDEAIDAASDDLLEIITRIDPDAAVPDRYWSTFVDDARMGDLSTQAVTSFHTS